MPSFGLDNSCHYCWQRFYGLSIVSFIIKVQIVPSCSRTLACVLSLNPLHLKSVDSSLTLTWTVHHFQCSFLLVK